MVDLHNPVLGISEHADRKHQYKTSKSKLTETSHFSFTNLV